MDCPVCGSQDFYVKSPADEFETYEFSVAEGKPTFSPETGAEAPTIGEATETFCAKCAWHGKLKTLLDGKAG